MGIKFLRVKQAVHGVIDRCEAEEGLFEDGQISMVFLNYQTSGYICR